MKKMTEKATLDDATTKKEISSADSFGSLRETTMLSDLEAQPSDSSNGKVRMRLHQRVNKQFVLLVVRGHSLLTYRL